MCGCGLSWVPILDMMNEAAQSTSLLVSIHPKIAYPFISDKFCLLEKQGDDLAVWDCLFGHHKCPYIMVEQRALFYTCKSTT